MLVTESTHSLLLVARSTSEWVSIVPKMVVWEKDSVGRILAILVN